MLVRKLQGEEVPRVLRVSKVPRVPRVKKDCASFRLCIADLHFSFLLDWFWRQCKRRGRSA